MANESSPLLIFPQNAVSLQETTSQVLAYEGTRIDTTGNDISDEEKEGGHHHPAQTIGILESFILLTNNLTGPGMLGLPKLFVGAGWMPCIFAILFSYLSASFCGSFLSHSIAGIKGNINYQKGIDFTEAFERIMGGHWYFLAEVFFLLSCSVQAIAGLIEAAQSLDGFLGSYMGGTYGIQLYPQPSIVFWDPSICESSGSPSHHHHHHHHHHATFGLDGEDCIPFSNSGGLLFSLGYVLTALIFLPFSLGDLKETIAIQIFSFVLLMLLLFQFTVEFFRQGLHYTVPAVGNDWTSLSQVMGVVLFNYAYAVTIPSWLTEKKSNVPVNLTIWQSTTFSTSLYIAFGYLAANAYGSNIGANLLTLMTSSAAHPATRVGAVLFGVLIIGAGVPVFCVIIKQALTHGQIKVGERSALFFGAEFPFLVSWLFYQGDLLTALLNWTGLIVNGISAFILPLILAHYALANTELGGYADSRTKQGEIQSHDPAESHFSFSANAKSLIAAKQGNRTEASKEYSIELSSLRPDPITCYESAKETCAETGLLDSAHPLPLFLRPYHRALIYTILVLYILVISANIIFDIAAGSVPDS